MEIRVEEVDGAAVAHISGEADADNCHELGEALLESPLLQSGDIAALHLNLRELSFIDSSAVSELLRIRSSLAEHGTKVTIVEPSSAVHRVMEITGLLDVFGVET